ncbi:hypothetical protein DRO49_04100, partial [Candidatus Bathyarchaeota archaeon]
SDALQDGIIPPYKIIRLMVHLTPSEEFAYEELTEKINKITKVLTSKYPELKKAPCTNFVKLLNKLHEKIGDELITRYIALLNQRKLLS